MARAEPRRSGAWYHPSRQMAKESHEGVANNGRRGTFITGGCRRSRLSLNRRNDRETIACFKLTNGETVWKVAYDASYEVNDAAADHGKGPKSTPVVAEGRIYTFGISGILSCWDASTGTKIWRKEFGKQFKSTSPLLWNGDVASGRG